MIVCHRGKNTGGMGKYWELEECVLQAARECGKWEPCGTRLKIPGGIRL